MERFEFTVKGCAEAKQWLQDTDQLHLLEHELSTDGWTLTAMANALHKKQYDDVGCEEVVDA